MLRGIVMGGSRNGQVVECATNTLLLPSVGEPTVVPGHSTPIFEAGQRQKYHYMTGVDGLGFWWPVKFGGPMVAYTEVVKVLQHVYLEHYNGKQE